MRIAFEKWHGTGNDFIMIDDRDGRFPVGDPALISGISDRHFGVGSDGLVLIQAAREAGCDFHMEFFNPDASRSFCGNGSRCAFAFWSALKGTEDAATFGAIDGMHQGRWEGVEVGISLPPIPLVKRSVAGEQVDFVNTGSPHQLIWVDDTEAVDIHADAPPRRFDKRIWPTGSNVNYLQADHGAIRMRTFERGVEDETLSCGSGVVAAALSALTRGLVKPPVHVVTRGGRLRVEAYAQDDGFTGVRLIGPVQKVFTGTLDL